MKIQVVSDLHTEFYKLRQHKLKNMLFISPDTDVLVIAGDVNSHITDTKYKTFKEAREEILELPAKHILLVLGNHDYWGMRVDTAIEYMRMLFEGTHVTVLQNDEITIDGQRFVGTTGWFPNPPSYLDGWIDFRKIKNLRNVLVDEYEKANNAIFNDRLKDSIVITHMAPTGLSTEEQYKQDKYSWFFTSGFESDITRADYEDNLPKLWIHGHMHKVSDDTLYNVRTVCNAYGYPNELFGQGKPMIIDI